MANNYKKYSKDYSAEIQRRKKIDPKDPAIAQLTNLRQSKISKMSPAQAKSGGHTQSPVAGLAQSLSTPAGALGAFTGMTGAMMPGVNSQPITRGVQESASSGFVNTNVPSGATIAPEQPADPYGYKTQIAGILDMLSKPRETPKESPYQQQIGQLLTALSQPREAAQYDPTQDIGLQQAQEQAQAQALQQMARRGMLYSDTAKSRTQQVAQELIPQYQQRAEEQDYRQQQTERQNIMDQLKLLTGLEQTGYERATGEEQARRSDLASMLGAVTGMEQTQYQRGRDVAADKAASLEREWERSEKNPVYKTSLINLEIKELESKAMKDPDSPYNQTLKNELEKIKNENALSARNLKLAEKYDESDKKRAIEAENVALDERRQKVKTLKAQESKYYAEKAKAEREPEKKEDNKAFENAYKDARRMKEKQVPNPFGAPTKMYKDSQVVSRVYEDPSLDQDTKFAVLAQLGYTDEQGLFEILRGLGYQVKK